jgi:hypothetical protein
VFAENLDAFVEDFGVPVFFGTQQAVALFEEPDGTILNRRVISRGYRIVYEASAFSPGLAHDDTVYVGVPRPDWTWDSTVVTFDSTEDTMDGSGVPAFTVLEVLSIEDGAFLEARLEAQTEPPPPGSAVRTFTENLAVFIKDFGVPVAFGSQSTLALFDEPDAVVLGQRAISREYSMVYDATQLTGLVRSSTVTINAVAYTVREVLSLEDGAFFEARLEAQ